jgi:methyl-accepting chemotaxis protein
MTTFALKNLAIGSLRLRGKILLLFGITTFSLFVAAAVGFWAFKANLRVFEEVNLSQNNAVNVEATETVFKKQVQEWKDTLLRGKKPEALNKYWTNFQHRESDVRAEAEKLSRSISDPEAAQLVAQFLAAHKSMGEAYRRGFQKFKDHNFDSAVGDAAVAGIDRAPTELLGKAKDRLISLASARATEAKESAYRAMWVSTVLFLAVMGVGAIIFFIVIQRSVVGPIRKLTGVLIDLTNDRMVEVPYTRRNDEVGEIAKATEIFKQSVADKAINFRIRAALDNCKANVMMADENYNINYMNPSQIEMFRPIEAELRKNLAGFDLNKLVGCNIDIFHKDPARIRKMLEGLQGTYETHIQVGQLKFHLFANAIYQNSKRIGTVVEWKNETAEKTIESEVNGIVQAVVAGDFAQRVPLEGKKDFMLNLATAMNSLCENTGRALDDMASMMAALARGDLTKRISADYQGKFGQLKTDANMMAEQIASTIAEIKAGAREVTNASNEISASTTDLSQRTEEQAASLEETSASMEEISSTVKKNAENAQAANQSAASTREVAGRGGQVVAQAVDAMAKIEDSSRKISDIIGVIDEIARQTNLLALNAAVEAARAGDAGRGFAVVASEVRSLAQRSSQAAKDIKDLITSSNSQVKDGVDLVNKAGTALTEIVESIKSVAAIVSDIATASIEQSTGIEQVNKALTQMDEVTQQNSALVEENAATAKTLEHQANAMDERIAFFRLDEAAASGTARAAKAVTATTRRSDVVAA